MHSGCAVTKKNPRKSQLREPWGIFYFLAAAIAAATAAIVWATEGCLPSGVAGAAGAGAATAAATAAMPAAPAVPTGDVEAKAASSEATSVSTCLGQEFVNIRGAVEFLHRRHACRSDWVQVRSSDTCRSGKQGNGSNRRNQE